MRILSLSLYIYEDAIINKYGIYYVYIYIYIYILNLFIDS